VPAARAASAPLPASFWALWTGLLVNRAATFVVPFLGLYLVRERGFSAAVAGQIMALYGLGSALSGPLGGALADRFGRKPTMLLGLLSSAAAVAGLAVARAPVILAALTFTSALLGETYRPAAHATVAAEPNRFGEQIVAPGEKRPIRPLRQTRDDFSKIGNTAGTILHPDHPFELRHFLHRFRFERDLRQYWYVVDE